MTETELLAYNSGRPVLKQIFCEKKFFVGIPIEGMPDQAYTGYSLREGSLLSCTFKDAASVSKAYICSYYSSVLEIKDSEISKFN